MVQNAEQMYYGGELPVTIPPYLCVLKRSACHTLNKMILLVINDNT